MTRRYTPNRDEVEIGDKVAHRAPVTNRAMRELKRTAAAFKELKDAIGDGEETPEHFEQASELLYHQLAALLVYEDGEAPSVEALEQHIGWIEGNNILAWLHDEPQPDESDAEVAEDPTAESASTSS